MTRLNPRLNPEKGGPSNYKYLYQIWCAIHNLFRAPSCFQQSDGAINRQTDRWTDRLADIVYNQDSEYTPPSLAFVPILGT